MSPRTITIDEVNQAAVARLHAAEPVLEDVRPAGDVMPGLRDGIVPPGDGRLHH